MEALELKKKKNPYENILYPHSRILKEIVCGRKRDKERLIQGTVQSLLLLVSLTQKSSSCTRRPVCFNVGHRKKITGCWINNSLCMLRIRGQKPGQGQHYNFEAYDGNFNCPECILQRRSLKSV